jgi:alpha-L-rhamnosidase
MAAYQATDKGHVATAYFCRSALLMSRIAAVLGREAGPWTELAARVRDAWRRMNLTVPVPPGADLERLIRR